MSETEAVRIISSCVRIIIAMQRSAHLARFNIRPFTLRVMRATGLAQTDSGFVGGASDPFVVVTAIEPNGDQVLMYKTRVLQNTLQPIWDEEVCMTGCTGHSTIVFTLLDKDLIQIGGFDFLGQTSYNISEHSLWHDAEPFTVKLPLRNREHPLYTERNKLMKIAGDEGRGELTVEFVPRNIIGSISGFASRHADAVTGYITTKKAKWETNWCTLTLEHGLVCYESPRNLNKIMCSIHPDQLGEIHMKSYEGKSNVLCIESLHEEAKEVHLSFENDHDVHTWENKLKVVKRKIEEKIAQERLKNRRSTRRMSMRSPSK